MIAVIVTGVIRVVVMTRMVAMVRVTLRRCTGIVAQGDALDLQQAQLRGPRQGVRRPRQPGRQLGSHPDHHIGTLQRLGVRRAHLVMMRAGPLGQQDAHLGQIAHDLLDQGAGGDQVCDDLRGGQGRGGGQ